MPSDMPVEAGDRCRYHCRDKTGTGSTVLKKEKPRAQPERLIQEKGRKGTKKRCVRREVEGPGTGVSGNWKLNLK